MYKICREYVKIKKLHDVILEKCAAYLCDWGLCFKEDFALASSKILNEGDSRVEAYSN